MAEKKAAPKAPTSAQGEELPAEAQAAVEELKEDPGSVLEFAVYPDRVVLILLDYKKYTFSAKELAGRVKKLVGK